MGMEQYYNWNYIELLHKITAVSASFKTVSFPVSHWKWFAWSCRNLPCSVFISEFINYKLTQLTAAKVSLTMLLTVFLTWWCGVDVINGSMSSKLPFRGRRVGFLMRHPAIPPLKWRTFSRQVWIIKQRKSAPEEMLLIYDVIFTWCSW